MSISLIGIIWVQLYWISNAIEVREAQFKQSVNNAMGDVVARLETRQAVLLFEKEASSHETHTRIAIGETEGDTNVWLQEENIRTIQYFGDSLRTEDYIVHHSVGHEQEVITEFSTSSGDTSNGSIMVAVFASDSSAVIPDVSFDFDTSPVEQHFGNVFRRMAIEFKSIKNPVQALLKGVRLDSLIEQALTNNGIETTFEYGVYSNEKDSLFTEHTSKGFTSSHLSSNHKTNLFPHDILSKDDFLLLHFPSENNYVLSSMAFMLTCSGLFTLIIILTFIGTIYYMLKQKRMSEIKSDFINNMTHEFKTPIATISLAVDSITHPKVQDNKEMVNYYAQIIKEENKRMNNQVENVLNTALLEKEELQLKVSEINVHELINKAVGQMSLQLEKAAGLIKTSLNASEALVAGDEMHLYNVVVNLLDNAIKYSKHHPEVEIITASSTSGITIEVKDNGIGMNAETQRKIFDKFFRVTKGNIHDVKGFGIGLSYVKAVVTAHQGVIDVTSELGKGTSMLITLPKNPTA